MKKYILLALLSAICIWPQPAPASADAPTYGGTLRWHEPANPPTLDPHAMTDTTSARVALCIFESLVTNSEDGQRVEPWLAESWTVSEDGTRWTFNLRRDVRFHAASEGGRATENGGRVVTAADWKWSFERMIRDKFPRAYYIDCIAGYAALQAGEASDCSGIRAVDDYTLEFTLSRPFAPFLSVLANGSFVVLPREDVEKWGKAFNFHPVGTGPFRFETWQQDQRLTLSRNPDYWGRDARGNQLPYLDAWQLVVIPDGTVAWEEFKNGNLDIQRDIPDRLVRGARASLGPHLLERALPGVYYFGFNCRTGIFADHPDLRRALNYAVDRERINELVMEGLFFPAKGIMPPSMPGHNPDLEGYSYDPERARALMKQAGYEKGFEVTLQTNHNLRHKAVAEAIQAQVAELGIVLKIQTLDWGAHIDTLDRGTGAPMYRMGWVVESLDPDDCFYGNLYSGNAGAKGNHSFYKNETVDRLLTEARRETDWNARVALYREAERIVVDDAPWLFLFYYYNNLASQKWVRGATLPAFGDYRARMDTVWLAGRAEK